MGAPKIEESHNKKDLGGRPIKYTDEFIEKEADELEKWLNESKFTWFEEFALKRDYNPDLLSEWAEKNKRFSGAFKKAKSHQRVLLMKCGLDKSFNFNMVQLLLGNQYGIFGAQENKVDPATLKLFETLMQQFNKNQEKE